MSFLPPLLGGGGGDDPDPGDGDGTTTVTTPTGTSLFAGDLAYPPSDELRADAAVTRLLERDGLARIADERAGLDVDLGTLSTVRRRATRTRTVQTIGVRNLLRWWLDQEG